MPTTPSGAKFSRQTVRFLLKAGRQRHPTWLERNREEYERVLQLPLQRLANHLKSAISPIAPGYHFPTKGLGRLRRPAHRVAEHGGGLYRSWMHYSASIPSGSRFDHNPNLFFMIDPHDKAEGILVAGGLYMPSSRQLRAIREAIAEDASAFDRLFADRHFSRAFKGGFSDERIATRPPRGFDPAHPRMGWLKLQAYFVWKPYSWREFQSLKFPEIVERDWRQVLRLNELLHLAIQGRLPRAPQKVLSTKQANRQLADRLIDLDVSARKMDF